MPALPNRRQELFAQKLAQGIPPYRAYPEAGYKQHESNPYRMSENERVKNRLIELTGTADIQFLSDRDTLIKELALSAFAPIGSDQVKVPEKNKAVMDIARLAGHLIERREIGKAGDFAKLNEHELDTIIDASYSEIALLEGEAGDGVDEEDISSEEEEG